MGAPRRPGPAPSRRARCARCSTASRGVYDLHELGHDGGAAPPLARAGRGPGRASGPATARSTSRPARATWRSALARRVGPGGRRSSARTSPRGCSTARARSPPTVRWEWANALELPYSDGEFDAATVGFGARNFSDLDRGLAEMARVVRPGGRVVVLEITTPPAPAAVDVLLGLVRPRGARRWAGWPAIRRRTRTCRARSSASPVPSRWPRGWRRPGSTTCAGSSPRAGSSPCTPGRCGEQRRGGARGRRGRRRARAGADGAARGAARGAGQLARRRARRARRLDDPRRRQAPAAAAGVPRRRRVASPTTTACCARRSRWS